MTVTPSADEARSSLISASLQATIGALHWQIAVLQADLQLAKAANAPQAS